MFPDNVFETIIDQYVLRYKKNRDLFINPQPYVNGHLSPEQFHQEVRDIHKLVQNLQEHFDRAKKNQPNPPELSFRRAGDKIQSLSQHLETLDHKIGSSSLTMRQAVKETPFHPELPGLKSTPLPKLGTRSSSNSCMAPATDVPDHGQNAAILMADPQGSDQDQLLNIQKLWKKSHETYRQSNDDYTHGMSGGDHKGSTRKATYHKDTVAYGRLGSSMTACSDFIREGENFLNQLNGLTDQATQQNNRNLRLDAKALSDQIRDEITTAKIRYSDAGERLTQRVHVVMTDVAKTSQQLNAKMAEYDQIVHQSNQHLTHDAKAALEQKIQKVRDEIALVSGENHGGITY